MMVFGGPVSPQGNNPGKTISPSDRCGACALVPAVLAVPLVLSCRTEMNVLQKVHHPHCVQFFGAVTKQKPFMIITEFMGCGSMSDMFRGGEAPSLRRAVQLALDCARGIAYLHNHNPLSIIHRWATEGQLCVCCAAAVVQGGVGHTAAARRERSCRVYNSLHTYSQLQGHLLPQSCSTDYVLHVRVGWCCVQGPEAGQPDDRGVLHRVRHPAPHPAARAGHSQDR